MLLSDNYLSIITNFNPKKYPDKMTITPPPGVVSDYAGRRPISNWRAYTIYQKVYPCRNCRNCRKLMCIIPAANRYLLGNQ